MPKKNADNSADKKNHRAILKYFLHFMCLIFPVAAAFLGAFFADNIMIFLSKNGFYSGNFTEKFKFFVSAFLFFVSAVIVFILTRSEKSIIEIKISKNSETKK